MDLGTYYARPFPLDLLVGMFCGDAFVFTEFMLTRNTHRVRGTYRSVEELRKELVRWPPTSVHIGPRMAMPTTYPGQHNERMSRNLAVDIDLTDYDNLRTCCSGKRICNRCWSGIALPVTRVVVRKLRTMGARKILCVFTAGRGVHIWVCERKLTSVLTETDLERIFNVLTACALFVNTSGKEHSVPLEMYDKIGCSLFTFHNNTLTPVTCLPETYGLDPLVVRIDHDASVRFHHTVKVPYSTHDSTGCVAVPFDPWQNPALSDVQIRLEGPRVPAIATHFPPVFVDAVYSYDEMKL